MKQLLVTKRYVSEDRNRVKARKWGRTKIKRARKSYGERDGGRRMISRDKSRREYCGLEGLQLW